MSLSEIDFARLYRAHTQRTNRRERAPEYWDDVASAMNQRAFTSPYAQQFEPMRWALCSWETRGQAANR